MNPEKIKKILESEGYDEVEQSCEGTEKELLFTAYTDDEIEVKVMRVDEKKIAIYDRYPEEEAWAFQKNIEG